MTTYVMRAAVDRWMSDAFLDPWRRYLRVKRERGEVLTLGNIHVDTTNLFLRPFRCDTRVCTPGKRGRGRQSCCVELEAAVTPEELRGVERWFPRIDAVLRQRDPGWARRPLSVSACRVETPDFTLQLAKRGGRCALSFLAPSGELLCAAHAAALEHGEGPFKVKPRLCSIFPLLHQDMQDGTFFLSRLDQENGCLVGFSSYKELACLHGEKTFGPDGPPGYLDFLWTLEGVFGGRMVRDLDAAARSWRRARGLKTPSARLPA
jgi:hypothetical protein